MRWMLTLDCEHRVLSDERQVEGREYCRPCDALCRIVACDEYEDREAG